MPLVHSSIKNRTYRAIGPPNIVDLPEFAPDFPTTALFGWAFGALNALDAALVCPGIQERLPRGNSSSLLPERNLRTGSVRVARALVPSVQGGHCVAASHSHMWLLSRGAGEHLPMQHVFVMILMPKRHARDAFAPYNGVQ